MRKIWIHIKTSVKVLVILTIMLGLAYPLAVTGLAYLLFPYQANGSLVRQNSQVVGSSLIGQQFTDPGYFHGRPSQTDYQAAGASNSAVADKAFTELIAQRIEQLQQENPDATEPIPMDLLTSSGSGLDPDISPAAALYQISRIAKSRGISPDLIRQLVIDQTTERQFKILGEPRVNVLQLNRQLDQLDSH
jgi:K+-transporting ATPase ATPase C chain